MNTAKTIMRVTFRFIIGFTMGYISVGLFGVLGPLGCSLVYIAAKSGKA